MLKPVRALAALITLMAAGAGAGVLEGRPLNYVLRQENGVTYQMDVYYLRFDGSQGSSPWIISSGSKTVDIHDKKDLKELKAVILKAMESYHYLDISTSRSDAKILPGTKVDLAVYMDR